MKRRIVFMMVCIALFLATTGFTVAKEVSPLKNAFPSAVKIKVEFESDGRNQGIPAFTITDTKMVSDIVTMIKGSKLITDKTKYNSMSGMATKNNKLTIYPKKGNATIVTFAYDDPAFGLGYVIVNGKYYEPVFDFFRYLNDLLEYQKFDTKMHKQSVELLKKYGWTTDYRVNTVRKALPQNLKYEAGEFPIKLYWAYNNELSRTIGLDLTKYLGKTVEVSIYRLRESLPKSMFPRMNARGIILQYQGKIIGAYIDAGRHDSFGCSLNRKLHKQITGKDWDDWVLNYMNQENPIIKKLAAMTPQQIITEYFSAMDRHDEKMMYACMSTQNISGYLSTNMSNNKLFNESFKDAFVDGYNNVISAKLIKIGSEMEMDNPKGVVEFSAEIDFKFVKEITSSSGKQSRFILLKKESEKTGWRITSIGTGP